MGTTCSCGSCSTCAGAARGPGRRGLAPPGRSHAAFKQRMLDYIAALPALSELTTRDETDPAIALVDAWAASLHVLSFYAERYQAEAYLETATDIASVRGLASQVGYRAKPAISAATTLAFKLDSFPESPAETPIRAGSKVQTIPKSEEAPVVFETSEDLMARPVWNAIEAKRTRLRYPGKSDTNLRVRQIQMAGRIGDLLVFRRRVGDEPSSTTFESARLKLAATSPLANPPFTEMTFDHPLAVLKRSSECNVAFFSRRASLFGYNATVFVMLDRLVRQRILKTPIAEKADIDSGEREWKGLKATLYGYLEDISKTKASDDLKRVVDLDAIYPEAMVGRHIVLKSSQKEALFRIDRVAEIARSDFGISAKVTRLSLDRDASAFDNLVRDTAVFIQTEDLDIAEIPATASQPGLDGRRILLAEPTDLPAGRVVVVQGMSGGLLKAEVATVAQVSATPPSITFRKPLAFRYQPQDLVIFGNAVAATHGENKSPFAALGPPGQMRPAGEVLGSGDSRQASQTFALRQKPLTHVQASTPSGYAPAIEVRVDGALRPNVERLYGLPDESPAYAVEFSANGTPRIHFASRLRTGEGNVTANYRVGGGAAGNLDPGRLKVPLSMVMGLREVTNPVAADGGTDPETAESIRDNAATAIVTLDRVVSLQDYANFARNFGGVAKAQAALCWSGAREVVLLTVAGPQGRELLPSSTLYQNLQKAIAAAAPPGRAFRLLPARRVEASATIALLHDPAYDRSDVETRLTAALAKEFAPDQRSFAVPLAKSALVACAQRVSGVQAARIASLTSDTQTSDSEVLFAATSAFIGMAAQGAEYITLSTNKIRIVEFAP